MSNVPAPVTRQPASALHQPTTFITPTVLEDT